MNCSIYQRWIKFNIDTWMIMILVFPMMKPSLEALMVLVGETVSSTFYDFLWLWNYASIAIILLLFIEKNIKIINKMMFGTIIIIILCVSLLISTIVMGEYNLLRLLRTLSNIVSIFLLMEVCGKDRLINYLEAMYYFLTFIMILNAITIFIYYPNGMYENNGNTNYYLYALDNVGFIISLHGFFCGMLYNLVKKKRLTIPFVFGYVFIFGAYVYARCGTATIIICGCVLLMLCYSRKLLRFIDYRLMIIVCALIFYCIVIAQSVGAFSFILDLIGKSTGFNGRTTIWGAVFQVLPQHLLLGVGTSDSVVMAYLSSVGPEWLGGIGHLHNVVLEFLFKGGIVAIVLFALIWGGCYKKMQVCRKNVIAIVLCIQFLLTWLTSMFEFRLELYSFWILPIMMYNVDTLSDMYNRTKREKKFYW